ncbi:leucine--tRNA ligase [Actinospica sp.]|uniref:leucine--tRNA ligase n=1 Tax=Actinospica sp. TaxID=1872142 RepID=UPI002CD527E2|nr:leucine--tRNA ligase [Actinospica sp.]HWG27284.1 leucine--tRNA ligase [Actinospica sp.]
MTQSTAPAAGDEPAYRYGAALAREIETRWQTYWSSHGTFEAPNPTGSLKGDVSETKHSFVMDMFPYPSGSGVHVGHPIGYIGTDVFARYQRMNGYTVLHTLGFDAFGLPAEQHAVATGEHPRVSTEAAIANYRRQLGRIGFGHDPRRSITTIDPAYYRWTQWIFLQIFNSWYDPKRDSARPISELIAEFESGGRPTPDGRAWAGLSGIERDELLGEYRLAYSKEVSVNWCPGLGTVLANEEVTADGRSERGNFPVFKSKLRQWMMRITAYGDRLISDLEVLDWPEAIKLQQRNWIGRSEGARVDFPMGKDAVTVFTTRPDTLFGATYMVLAPEHDLVTKIAPDAWPEGTPEAWRGGAASPVEAVTAYRAMAAAKSEVDRQADAKTKTGVFTGGYATNPVSGERIPVFIADYVLMGYGTGAIMAVPAHDTRDFAFARAFGLPIRCVVEPTDGRGEDTATWDDAFVAYEAEIVNSANDEVSLNGLGVVEAKARITQWLSDKGIGEGTVTFRLRDWLFSRQRYWGEPFPIVYDEDGVMHGVPESMLPVELPEVEDFSPRTFDPDDADTVPETPLSRNAAWVDVELDLGDGRGVRKYTRETNTMPNWAGSCWYELRYIDPDDENAVVDPVNERYWMGPDSHKPNGGVDLYIGGAEHAVLHLLYSRFWHKVLFDLGYVSSKEPFHRLFNQGMITADVYRDARGFPVPAAEVETDGDKYFWQGAEVSREAGKMGKSLKNSVSPDDFCDTYGADTLRVYEMSMGPLEVSKPWDTKAVSGAVRFLQRVWRNIVDEETGDVRVAEGEPDTETLRAAHQAVAGVAEDVAGLRFNTAIAKLIVLNNHLTKLDAVPRATAEMLVLTLAPFAPHLAEELWGKLGHAGSLAYEPVPVVDPRYLVADEVTCVIQVQGKVRDKIQVPPDISEDALRELALATEGAQRALDGRAVRTVIVRAPKLVNIVPA